MPDQWHYRLRGREYGPVPFQRLKELVELQVVDPDADVKSGRMPDWVPAETIPELAFAPKPSVRMEQEPEAEHERFPVPKPSTDKEPSIRADWHYVRNGKQQGPVTFENLQRLAATDELKEGDEVWRQGSAVDCTAARNVPDLFPRPAQPMPADPLPLATERSSLGTKGDPIHDLPMIEEGDSYKAFVAEVVEAEQGLHYDAQLIHELPSAEKAHLASANPDSVKDGRKKSNLTSCSDCGHMVSIRAKSCPKCGAPQDTQIPCHDCDRPFSSAAKTCPNCGAPRDARQSPMLSRNPAPLDARSGPRMRVDSTASSKRQEEPTARRTKSFKEAYFSKGGMGLLDLIPGVRDAPKAVKYVLIVVGIVVVGGVLMALAVAIGNWQGNPHNPAPSPQPVSNITWEDVNKVYSNSSRLTNLQKDEQWKTFKGQRVRWMGKVHSVNDELTLLVQVGFNLFYDERIHLDPSQRATALTMKPGDAITFEATLRKWGAGNSWSPHTLGDGVIVSTPPPGNQNNAGNQLPFDNPPKVADQGVGKLAAFKKIVAKLDAHPGQLAGQAQLDIYANELRELFNSFQAIPFNAQVNRQEATDIVNLYDNRIKGQYRGQIFNLIEASVYEIRTALMR